MPENAQERPKSAPRSSAPDLAKSHLELGRGIRGKMLAGAREMIRRRTVEDPDIWPCAKSALEPVVEYFLLDLEHCMENASDIVAAPSRDDSGTPGPQGGGGITLMWLWLRAKVLSHYLPCDRSVYGKLKDPVYLLMLLATVVPVHGARVVFFLVILVMLVRPSPADEYQLTSFITAFKSTQFLTSGLLYMAKGSMAYLSCYTLEGQNMLGCVEARGPGAGAGLGQAVDWLGSGVLAWVAFAHLPSGKRVAKWGRSASTPLNGSASQVRERSRARLRKLLFYDAACFALSAACLALLTTLDSEHGLLAIARSPSFHANAFWCCVLYSLLSFPFVLFAVPGLQVVLTHCSATGYNRRGACVSFALRTSASKADGLSCLGRLCAPRARSLEKSKPAKCASRAGRSASVGHGLYLAESVRLVPGAIEQFDGVAYFRVEAVPDLTAQGLLGEPRQATHRYEDFVALIARLNQCAVRAGAAAAPPLPPPVQGHGRGGGLEALRRDLDTWLKDVVLDPRSRGIWCSELRDFLDFHELSGRVTMGRRPSFSSEDQEEERPKRKSLLNALMKHERSPEGDSPDRRRVKEKVADAMRAMHLSPTHSPPRERMWRSSSFTPSTTSERTPAQLPQDAMRSLPSMTPMASRDARDPPREDKGRRGFAKLEGAAGHVVSKLEHLKEKALHPRQHS